MKRDFDRLASESHDLLVIGGGIQGVAIARDAARRRLRVALVEREDFGAGTSMNSQRMIHGGARYLQNLDFARMRRSVLERREWMREFPDLVRPVPILVPSMRGAGKPPLLVRLGLTLSELLNPNRTAGLPPTHRIPPHHALSSEAALRTAPALEGLAIDGAIVFHDALMLDSEQLTLAFAREAWAEGARLANHAEAIELVHERGQVRGALVRDAIGGGTARVRAACVIHAGGPWAARSFDGAPDGSTGAPPTPRPRVGLIRAMALLTRALDDHHAIAVPSPRAGRLLFVTPWRGGSLVGVDEVPFEGDPSNARVGRGEVERFLAEIREALPSSNLQLRDVRRVFSGLLPIADDDPTALAREDRILEDEDGLVRVLGVKYTTAPSLARRVVDRALELVDARARARRAAASSALPDVAELDEEEREELRRTEPGGREVILESPRVVAGDLVFAIRRRMAFTLEDIALRRTPLAMLGLPPDGALERAAEVAGSVLEWDAERRVREVAAVRARFAIDAA